MENDGFLADGLEAFQDTVKQELGERYEVGHKINQYAQQLQYKIEVPRKDISADKLYSMILFSRTLSTYQGLLLLSYRGMSQQVKMLLRCMLESLFPLIAIQKNEGFTEELIENDEWIRRGNFHHLLDHRRRKNLKDPSIAELQALYDESDKKIKENNLSRLSVLDIARKAELLDYYDTLYGYTSWTVHASLRSLEEAIIVDDEVGILELKNEPESSDFGNIYATAIELILLSIIAIGELFEIDVSDIDDEVRPFLIKITEDDMQA